MRVEVWTVKVRDPYMGNWIPIKVIIELNETSIKVVKVLQGEGILATAKRIEEEGE